MTDGNPPVDQTGEPAGDRVKRSDVGYKRPPREHQFKNGEKPPPRKKKEVFRAAPMTETMRKVLGEERRVVHAGKVRWLTAADLVIRRAWLEAEKGSPALRREIFRLSLSFEAPVPELTPLVVTDRSASAGATEFRIMPIDEIKS